MATGGAFPLTLATNGDVALGRSDVALCLRIHKEGWTGTITGEPIWEKMSGRGRLASGIVVSRPMVSLTYYFFRDVPLCAALWAAVLCGRETRAEAAELWRNRSWMPLVAGCCSTMTYALVLVAMNFAQNIAYVQAFRQIGLVFGLFGGALFLHERLTAPKIVGVALILVGLALSVI